MKTVAYPNTFTHTYKHLNTQKPSYLHAHLHVQTNSNIPTYTLTYRNTSIFISKPNYIHKYLDSYKDTLPHPNSFKVKQIKSHTQVSSHLYRYSQKPKFYHTYTHNYTPAFNKDTFKTTQTQSYTKNLQTIYKHTLILRTHALTTSHKLGHIKKNTHAHIT